MSNENTSIESIIEVLSDTIMSSNQVNDVNIDILCNFLGRAAKSDNGNERVNYDGLIECITFIESVLDDPQNQGNSDKVKSTVHKMAHAILNELCSKFIGLMTTNISASGHSVDNTNSSYSCIVSNIEEVFKIINKDDYPKLNSVLNIDMHLMFDMFDEEVVKEFIKYNKFHGNYFNNGDCYDTMTNFGSACIAAIGGSAVRAFTTCNVSVLFDENIQLSKFMDGSLMTSIKFDTVVSKFSKYVNYFRIMSRTDRDVHAVLDDTDSQEVRRFKSNKKLINDTIKFVNSMTDESSRIYNSIHWYQSYDTYRWHNNFGVCNGPFFSDTVYNFKSDGDMMTELFNINFKKAVLSPASKSNFKWMAFFSPMVIHSIDFSQLYDECLLEIIIDNGMPRQQYLIGEFFKCLCAVSMMSINDSRNGSNGDNKLRLPSNSLVSTFNLSNFIINKILELGVLPKFISDRSISRPGSDNLYDTSSGFIAYTDRLAVSLFTEMVKDDATTLKYLQLFRWPNNSGSSQYEDICSKASRTILRNIDSIIMDDMNNYFIYNLSMFVGYKRDMFGHLVKANCITPEFMSRLIMCMVDSLTDSNRSDKLFIIETVLSKYASHTKAGRSINYQIKDITLDDNHFNLLANSCIATVKDRANNNSCIIYNLSQTLNMLIPDKRFIDVIKPTLTCVIDNIYFNTSLFKDKSKMRDSASSSTTGAAAYAIFGGLSVRKSKFINSKWKLFSNTWWSNSRSNDTDWASVGNLLSLCVFTISVHKCMDIITNKVEELATGSGEDPIKSILVSSLFGVEISDLALPNIQISATVDQTYNAIDVIETLKSIDNLCKYIGERA